MQLVLNGPIRYLLIALGFTAVGLAVIGIFLPILPTTPFLLLAAFLFGRSSPRFYAWLHSNRWFGAYLTNYRAGRGLPLREKVLTILALWVAILLSITLALTNWWMRGSLLVIATAVTVHLLRIPTYRMSAGGIPLPETARPDLPG
jgi:uncharacterized membrane protein YbaN (DUF454 family)